MAATQSTRAKPIRLCSPWLKPIIIETWPASSSPYKNKSSISSDASRSRIWNIKGHAGHFKS